MRLSASGFAQQPQEGEKRCVNSELWHACAGPLVYLPTLGSRVVYFPQGHNEQIAASTNKEANSQIPNYPYLPPQLICQLHNVTMHADLETDEVYAQMTLQPLNPQEQKDPYMMSDLGVIPSKQPTNYFCKTLTASDTSTHGGFSVPRRAAEKVFPPLDFLLQPPAQELIARDLHDNEWRFRHIFRGQPKRHLLTTGWSVFVSAKRLVAGDSVLFIWNETNQLLLGIRHANRPQTVMPSSSVLSSDSMHLGLLAAASHAAATNTRFTIFYNPRASPSEFVIPFSKYVKAAYHTQISVGMRFRMLFETEESSVRRYMGTITGVSDLDRVRWPNSHWRSVKVGWDESTTGERYQRVSLWEIEPLMTFPIYPSPFPLRLKRPWPTDMKDGDSGMNSMPIWLQGNNIDCGIQSTSYPGYVTPCMQPNVSMLGMQADMYQMVPSPSVVHFQNSPGRPNTVAHPHMMFQPQPSFPQDIQENCNSDDNLTRAMGPMPCHQQSFSDSNGKNATSPIVSPLHSLMGSFPQEYSFNFPRPNSSTGLSQAENSQNSFVLPPFPGREFPIDQDGNNDPHGNLLFGVNIEPSSILVHNGISTYSTNMPLASTNFMSNERPEFSSKTSIENAGQVKQPARSFVKVHKSGSFGRSLDIMQYCSYEELRWELGRMFGLEGQLEDPLRSGWQLVFVDRENDVLLVGDGPWPEFVNSVGCIKIMSLQEVQQMGASSF